MNFNDSKSIYQQIATRICDEIMLGVYEEGNRIPSVRDYASQMGSKRKYRSALIRIP